MDQRESNTKQKESNEESNRDEAAAVVVVTAAAAAAAVVVVTAAAAGAAAAAAVPVPVPVPVDAVQNGRNLNQTADIFRLNIDCFEDLFDYSTFTDLIAVGKTCKRMQNVAGYCFSQTYSTVETYVAYTGLNAVLDDGRTGTDVTHFTKFIKIVRISGKHPSIPRFLKIQPDLPQLKKLVIVDERLTDDVIVRMMETFGKLETLCLKTCYGNYDKIISHCAKLKLLCIHKCYDFNYNWLTRKCPTLEDLAFVPSQSEEAVDVVKFLELNPNIRKFGTSGAFLWTNQRSLLNASNIKLHELRVDIWKSSVQLGELCRLLNELYKRGFYQRLKLKLSNVFRPGLCQLNALVHLHHSGSPIALSAFTNLEEICIVDGSIIDVERASISLVNLKRIRFRKVNIVDIMPFIRRSARLKQLAVASVEPLRNTDVIDLAAMNRERQKLANANKITFYVNEQVYLANKWALRELDLKLIRLTRLTYCEWDDDLYI